VGGTGKPVGAPGTGKRNTKRNSGLDELRHCRVLGLKGGEIPLDRSSDSGSKQWDKKGEREISDFTSLESDDT